MVRRLILTPCPLAAASAAARDRDALVLTPNRRAARALRVSPCSLLDQARERLAAARPPLAIADGVAASRHLRRAVEETIGGDEVHRVAQRLSPSLSRLLRTGADLDAVAARGSERARQLARVALRYRALLLADRAVASAEALHVAAGRGASPRRVVVAGYGRLDHDEAAFVEALAGDGSVVVLPGAGGRGAGAGMFAGNRALADRWAAAGWQIEEVPADASCVGERLAERLAGDASVDAPVTVQAYADQEAEARGVLQQVKALLREGVRPEDIVVATRSEPLYGPVLAAVAEEYGIRLRLNYSVPLSETRVGGFVQALVDVMAQDCPFETTLRLVGQALADTLPTAVRRAVCRVRATGRAAWDEHELPLLAPLQKPRSQPLREWARWLEALLREIELERRVAPWARETAAYRELDDALEALAAEPASDALDLAGFGRELRGLLDLLSVPVMPGRGGVAVHTPLALFGARFRHVFVVGAAEGHLPAPVGDDSYLDFRERERLSLLLPRETRLETAAEAALRERLSFWMLLGAVGERLVVAYPAALGGRAVLPSPYVGELADALPPVREPTAVASSLEWRRRALRNAGGEPGGPLADARRAWAVEHRRELPWPHDAHDGNLAEPVEPPGPFSVSQLTELGQCPFRWFAARALWLAEPDEAEAEIPAYRRGSLLHTTLALAVEAAVQLGEWPDIDALDELVSLALRRAAGEALTATGRRRDAIDAAAAAYRRDIEESAYFLRLPHWELLRREWLAELRRAIRGDGFVGDGCAPVAFEQAFGYGEQPTRWRGLEVRGRIDRVDRAGADGPITLIDYKTGTTTQKIKDFAGRLNVDLQLAVYREVYGAERAYYYLLGAARKMGDREQNAEEKDAVREAFAAEVRQRLANGDFSVDPDLGRDACRFCDLPLVCRVGPRNARKRG